MTNYVTGSGVPGLAAVLGVSEDGGGRSITNLLNLFMTGDIVADDVNIVDGLTFGTAGGNWSLGGGAASFSITSPGSTLTPLTVYSNGLVEVLGNATAGTEAVNWQTMTNQIANSEAGSVAWGNITGTLANQTDLNTELTNRYTKSEADSQFIEDSEKAAVNGVATLDGGGKVPFVQIPAIAITDVYVVDTTNDLANITNALQGDVTVVLDTPNAGTNANSYIATNTTLPSSIASWVIIEKPLDYVQSVNGKLGNVVLYTDDIDEGSTNLYYTIARTSSDGFITNNQSGVTFGALDVTVDATAGTDAVNWQTMTNQGYLTAEADTIASVLGRGDNAGGAIITNLFQLWMGADSGRLQGGAGTLAAYDAAGKWIWWGDGNQRGFYSTNQVKVIGIGNSVAPVLLDDDGIWLSEGTATSGEQIVNYQTMTGYVTGLGYFDTNSSPTMADGTTWVFDKMQAKKEVAEEISTDTQLTLDDGGKVYIVDTSAGDVTMSLPTNTTAATVGTDFRFINISTNLLIVDASTLDSIEDSDPGAQIYSGVNQTNDWPWSSITLKQAESNWWHSLAARGDWTTTGTNASPIPTDNLPVSYGEMTNYVAGAGSDSNAVWGNITGTLANQTDLNTELTNRYTKSESDGLLADKVDITSGVATNLAMNGSTESVEATNATMVVNWQTLTNAIASITGLPPVTNTTTTTFEQALTIVNYGLTVGGNIVAGNSGLDIGSSGAVFNSAYADNVYSFVHYFKELGGTVAVPAEGNSAIWQTDGGGTIGDDGDLLRIVTAGGVTSTNIFAMVSDIPDAVTNNQPVVTFGTVNADTGTFSVVNGTTGTFDSGRFKQEVVEVITTDTQLTLDDGGKAYVVDTSAGDVTMSLPTNATASTVGTDFRFINVSTNLLIVDAAAADSIEDSDPGAQIYSGVDGTNDWPWSSITLKQAESNWWHSLAARGDWTTTGTNASPIPAGSLPVSYGGMVTYVASQSGLSNVLFASSDGGGLNIDNVATGTFDVVNLPSTFTTQYWTTNGFRAATIGTITLTTSSGDVTLDPTGALNLKAGSGIELDSSAGDIRVDNNIIPFNGTSNTYDIGTALLPFRDVYASTGNFGRVLTLHQAQAISLSAQMRCFRNGITQLAWAMVRLVGNMSTQRQETLMLLSPQLFYLLLISEQEQR
jgi:hypothetical protein